MHTEHLASAVCVPRIRLVQCQRPAGAESNEPNTAHHRLGGDGCCCARQAHGRPPAQSAGPARAQRASAAPRSPAAAACRVHRALPLQRTVPLRRRPAFRSLPRHPLLYPSPAGRMPILSASRLAFLAPTRFCTALGAFCCAYHQSTTLTARNSTTCAHGSGSEQRWLPGRDGRGCMTLTRARTGICIQALQQPGAACSAALNTTPPAHPPACQ